jgi:hypothetical protein
MDMPHRSRTSLLPVAAGLLLMSLGLPPAASAQNTTVLVPGKGHVFCPSTALVLGTVELPAGDCFKLAVFRDTTGTYLAFLPPTAPIEPGQVVSVGVAVPNPNGPLLLLLLLLPITAPTNVAVNTMMLVPARIETTGTQTRIVAMGGPLTNTIVLNPPVSNVVTVDRRSEIFCPSATLVSGNYAIPAGDCYRLAVLQNSSGTFLAFIPQAIALPAGQLISLNAPVLNGATMHLVPITTTATIPPNTLELVPATISSSGTQDVITLTGGPAVNTVVVLNVR